MGECHVNMKAEMRQRSYKPRNAEGARRKESSLEQTLPHSPRKKWTLLTCRSRISSLGLGSLGISTCRNDVHGYHTRSKLLKLNSHQPSTQSIYPRQQMMHHSPEMSRPHSQTNAAWPEGSAKVQNLLPQVPLRKKKLLRRGRHAEEAGELSHRCRVTKALRTESKRAEETFFLFNVAMGKYERNHEKMEIWTQTNVKGRKPRVDGGRDWSDASTGQGHQGRPVATASWTRLKRSPLRTLE
ncbi:uncharacterized protein LOC111525006 isoform X2 [Piliocolobus tephrosceles]|uniref:uncharacterized protein LOC111525006 isoform X2 n=1 Tax=Piliocolobus tephrosceles TaxID=591936 RepID=UPI000C29AF4D|nr:uncharacterized protein LOC111525006 isoform X2 [Piliocolobus tephrosceles]